MTIIHSPSHAISSMSSRVIVLPTCSICQDDEGGLEIISTMCGHTFHADCIRTWDANQRHRRVMTKCPVCNVELRKPVGSDPTQSRFIRLHSLTERSLDSTRSSSPSSNQHHQDVKPDIGLMNCRKELGEIRELLKERDAKIRQLDAQSESLRRESTTLNTTIRLLKQMQRDLEDRRAKCLRDLKKERNQRQTEQTSRLQEIGRLKAEIERQSDKFRSLKTERDGLQEQLSQKVAENDELQSFIGELSIERANFQAIESSLKSQLQSCVNQAQTLRVANHAFNRKLEEAKRKIASLEGTGNSNSMIATGSSSCSRSVQRCSKFYPDVSKATILCTQAIKDSNSSSELGQLSSGPTKRDRRTHQKRASGDTSRRLSSQSDQTHKRFRKSMSTTGKQPKVVKISSGSDDIPPSSESSQLFSSPVNCRHQAGKDLILPSLFGNGDQSTRTSRSNTTLKQSTSGLRDHHRVNDQQPSLSGLKFSTSSGKLISIGPKIKHR